MDPKTIHKLERALEKPTLDVTGRLGLKQLTGFALARHGADDGQGGRGRLRSGSRGT